MTDQKQQRRHYSPEQKAAIVRRHLSDKVPVSDLCDEYRIQPSVFYGWQKVVLDSMALAFERQADPGKPKLRERDLERKVSELEARLAKKDSVIAEISEDFVKLKKEEGHRSARGSNSSARARTWTRPVLLVRGRPWPSDSRLGALAACAVCCISQAP